MSHDETLYTPAVPGRLEVVPAGPADLDTIVAILEEAAAWLTARGIDQWRPGSFGGARRAAILEHVETGELYLARADGAAVATFALLWSDPHVWPDAPDDAGYVHWFAVRRTSAGRGIGTRLLGWTERAAAAAGKRYLRLDCMRDNRELRAYYERAGFIHHGDRSGPTWSAALYEKRVAE